MESRCAADGWDGRQVKKLNKIEVVSIALPRMPCTKRGQTERIIAKFIYNIHTSKTDYSDVVYFRRGKQHGIVQVCQTTLRRNKSTSVRRPAKPEPERS